jgi:hypothetical protein
VAQPPWCFVSGGAILSVRLRVIRGQCVTDLSCSSLPKSGANVAKYR